MKRRNLLGAVLLMFFGSGVILAGQIGSGDKISRALVGLQSQDRGVQARAHAKLVCMGSAAVPELIRLLGDETCPVRPELGVILGEIGDKDAIDPLIQVIQQNRQNFDLYQGALDGLSFFKDTKVIEAIIQELDKGFFKGDGNRAARDKLIKIGPPAIPALIEALYNESEVIQSGAIKSLGTMGAVEALPPLVEIIKDPKNHNSGILFDAAVALGSLSKEGSEALRCLAMDESPIVRRYAIRGLGANYDFKFDMGQALFDDYWDVCLTAYYEIYRRKLIDYYRESRKRLEYYAYQANRLEAQTNVPVIKDPTKGKPEPAEPIRIMVAVDASGKVDHAWIMDDDMSTLAKETLAAIKNFRFEPFVVKGRAFPVRTMMTFTPNSESKDNKLRIDFEVSGDLCVFSFNPHSDKIRSVRTKFPEIPPNIRKKNLQGEVIVEAETDIYGRVRSSRILNDAHPVLVQLARTAVLNWVYEPMIISGIPKACLIKIIFQFAPHGLVAVKEDFLY
jgi:hypothetical protein